MEDTSKTAERKIPRWVIPLALLCVLIGVGAWYFHGRGFWTDGLGMRVPAADAKVRDVLWTAPEALEPALLSTTDQQYEPAFSPDGTELYFVRGKPGHSAHIYVMYRRDNAWTKPAPLDSINGPSDDLSPRLTADGKYLLFSSDRPGGLGGFDIWAAGRVAGGWGKPFNLGAAVNTEFNECNPDPTPDGKHLIFSTDRKAAGMEQIQAWRATIRQTVSTDYDLWIARIDPAASVTAPTTAPASQPATTQATSVLVFKDAHEIPNINTTSVEGASCVSPNGDFLYFSSNRPGGFGKFDLYRSRIINGDFSTPENLGPTINTADNEADPCLAFGGFRLFFSSDRHSPQGVYALLQSDSHEVFPDTERRHLPNFGWSIWALVISIFFLIPLIMMLRNPEWRRRLNTLQRCLLLSLLIHAIVTFCLSFVLVTQEVARYVKKEMTTEIAVNLGVPTDVQVGQSIRSQISSDLPSSASPPAQIERMSIAQNLPQASEIKTQMPAHQADQSKIADISAPDLSKTVSMAAPAPKISVQAPAPSAASNLVDLAPNLATAKVADHRSDTLPAVEKPVAAIQRTQTAASPSAPAVAIASEVPKSSEIARDLAAKSLTTKTDPGAASHNIVPAVSQSATPAATVAPASDPKLADISPSPNAPRLSQANPTPSDASAPLPSAGPLATAIARPDDSASPAADIATRNIAAKPTTAPTTPSTLPDTGSIASRGNDPINIATAAVRATSNIGPIDTGAPALPEIAAGPPTARAGGDASPAGVQTRDVLPASARMSPSSAVPSPGGAIDVSAFTPAAGPAISPAASSTIAPVVMAVGKGTLGAPNISAVPSVAFSPTPLTGNLDPGPFVAPSSPFPRSAEERKPRVEKLGGTKDSEDAVDRGLAYLARNQEPDGRWSLILQNDSSRVGRRAQTAHDIGNTGLCVLALITHDHTPDKPGPYRDTVAKALNFLIDSQEDTGDLRGPVHLRGAGSGKGDMYDHAIATLALAETALMTKEKRYRDAALRGAEFIIRAQDPNTGGWRYTPGEAGDTSVFGWQIMALHACEQLGFVIPDRTREFAAYYISIATTGPGKMLASYRPRGGQPTGTMTAEMMYARMLLGQKLSDEQIAPVTAFLAQQPPTPTQPNLYYWYYGSLCMMQARNDDWKRWNTRSREALIALQNKGGLTDGGWNADPKYADRGGRVYTTAIAILTLEVYYRYQPLRGN